MGSKNRKRSVSNLNKKKSEVANSPDSAEVTAEEIERKIKELKKIEARLERSGSTRWPSFRTMYVFSEIVMILAIVGLGLYVYQTNQKHQVILNDALKRAQTEMDKDLEVAQESETYDMDEFCWHNDCDDVVPTSSPYQSNEEIAYEDIFNT